MRHLLSWRRDSRVSIVCAARQADFSIRCILGGISTRVGISSFSCRPGSAPVCGWGRSPRPSVGGQLQLIAQCPSKSVPVCGCQHGGHMDIRLEWRALVRSSPSQPSVIEAAISFPRLRVPTGVSLAEPIGCIIDTGQISRMSILCPGNLNIVRFLV
jgi:hypothetical protein